MSIPSILRTLVVLSTYLVALPVRVTAGQTSGEFYVSNFGNDANPGTAAQPFRTLEKARDAVRAVGPTLSNDVAVLLRGGTYVRTQPFVLDTSDSGRNGFRVVYRNYPGESPVISGGQRLTGWTREGDLWKATVSSGREARHFYVNGARATRARTAGTLPGAQLTATGYLTSDQTMRNWTNIQDAEVVIDSLWREFRCGIATVLGTTITLDQPGWNLVNSGFPVRGEDTVYVENAFELLDTPGEWYLNRQTGFLYYWPRAGEDMAQAETVLSGIETLVDAAGTPGSPIHDVRFEGITFAYAGWTRPDSTEGFAELQANWFMTGSGLARMPAAVTVNYSQAITFERNSFVHLGAAGLSLGKGTRDDIVSGNRFDDVSGNAFMLGDVDNANTSDSNLIPRNNQITNNHVHRAAAEYGSGVGMWIGYAQSTLIAHNELHDLPYSAISIGWGWGENDPSIAQNNIVEKNLIYDHVKRLIDGGGIYSLSAQPGNVYSGNVILEQYGEYGSMYLDNGARYITVSDNVIFGNRRVALIKGGLQGGDHYIHDNWWQDRYADDIWYYQDPESYLTTTPGPNRVENNHTIGSLGDAPTAILSTAGIESAYVDIRSGDALPPSSVPAFPSTPATPSNLQAISFAAADRAVLSWSAVPHAASYHLVIRNLTTAAIDLDTEVAAPTYGFSVVSGQSYQFTVGARNQIGEGAASTSAPFSFGLLPSVTLDRASLQFAALCGGSACTQQSASQDVHLVQSGTGSVTWTAVPTEPWLHLQPSSGSGPATVRIAMDTGTSSPLAGATGSVVFSFIGARNASAQVSVAFDTIASGLSQPPIGILEMPVSGTEGVSGSIAVTGWALDDAGVTAIRIFRDPVAPEPTDQLVFVGNAIRVQGARPDVAAAFAALPDNMGAGWGYLMLTDFLPNRGNGTFRIHAFAYDADGHRTSLGSTTLTCTNAQAVTPFGAIDTPEPGETVSGIVTNFGWVLGRGLRRADPLHGGAVTVLIDGQAVGSPDGWVPRADLTALFQPTEFAGVSSALGVFTFDSRTLTDGLHSIAWVVVDDEGHTAGVGSRFFTVANGGS